MPWFRIDDNLAFHHKTVAAGNAAMGLWVRAGSWCAQQLTDGFVPDHMVVTLGTKAQASRLVTVGLWSKIDAGYRFHEWNERQPSKESVEAERAAARERMARRRAKPQVTESGAGIVRANIDGTSPGVREPRPDPTRPEVTDVTSVAAPEAPATTGKATRRASQLPPDFRPSSAHVALAHNLRVNLHPEFMKFSDHHKAKGSLFKDWDAALNNWIRNAVKFGGPQLPPLPVTDPSQLPPPPSSDLFGNFAEAGR